jgi:hypothetical protein
VKCMHIGEEEVSPSHLITVVVPLEEEEVLAPQGPAIAVPPEEEVVPGPLSRSRCRALLEEEVP